jgi:hypothetical protein
MSNKEELITDKNELNEIFSSGYYASCTFFNRLPPRWEVDIVQIGCKFVDDNGHNDDKAANTQIKAGQNQTLTSTYKGCCRTYIIVMKARASDGKVWNFFETATVESGYCGGNFKMHLVPERTFAKGASTDTPPFKAVLEVD